MRGDLLVGMVFNVQKYSLHDGPGIRTTVFLKGCPLRCLWCHNPESQSTQSEVMFFEARCRSCCECVRVCPTGASGTKTATTNPLCAGCGRCVQVCAYGAREMVGREMSAGEVMSEVLRDRIFYDQSGGGVTFSGGEPMAQPVFLRQLLTECRAEGLRTTVDTSGFAAWESFEAVIRLVDVFLYDVKTMDDAKHRRYVGAPNGLVLENLRRLAPLAASLGKTVLARIPLIPGINDDAPNIESTGRFLQECGVRNVSVLPYHHIGAEKYRRLKREYGLPAQEPPSDDIAKGVAEALRGFGLTVSLGG